jgi:hypothetical protein
VVFETNLSETIQDPVPVALAYEDLKRRLAVDHRFDNIGYMRGKNDFVKSVLVDAQRWYATQ